MQDLEPWEQRVCKSAAARWAMGSWVPFEDCLQEARLQVLIERGRFTDQVAWEAIVTVAARRGAVEIARGAYRWAAWPSYQEDLEQAAPGAQRVAQERPEDRDPARLAMAILERLPEADVALLEAHFLEGLTYDQIGDRLGCGGAVIARRMRRALLRARFHGLRIRAGSAQ